VDDQESAEIYDPAAGMFSLVGSPMDVRGVFIATLLGDGRVLVAGGLDNQNHDL
jgi:hypothetical protein